MKYGKLIAKIFAHRSRNNNGQVAVALVAGLAAGAIISILFAPERGSEVRKGIAGKAKGLNDNLMHGISSLRNRMMGNTEMIGSMEKPEVPHFTHTTPKKRKSAIKDLIHEAHEQQSTEGQTS